MSRRPIAAQRGFSLLEALIALLVTSFGLLAIAGVSLKLAQSEDVSRQRGEATRLAQEKIEELRSFTQIDAAAGTVAWESLAGANETITDGTVKNGEVYNANTAFTRTTELFDSVDDPWRRMRVTVTWPDRATGVVEPHTTVMFNTIISKTDPFDSGSLAFPLPGNTTLKRPKNRSLNIPVPALDLGNGKSVVQLGSLAVVFSNDSGYVVLTCSKTVTTAADLESGCDESNAYIVAGYVSLDGPASFPASLAINTDLVTGTTGTVCSVQDAKDQNTGDVLAGYKYYLCVVKVAAAGAEWAGTMRLAAPGLNAGTNYLVCRFQFAPAGSPSNKANNPKNVQPYAQVSDSLDNQNYVITDASSCPTITSTATTQHQNCRSSNPNKNVNRATDCPATGAGSPA